MVPRAGDAGWSAALPEWLHVAETAALGVGAIMKVSKAMQEARDRHAARVAASPAPEVYRQIGHLAVEIGDAGSTRVRWATMDATTRQMRHEVVLQAGLPADGMQCWHDALIAAAGGLSAAAHGPQGVLW